MRRRGPPPWDLMVSVITAALALVLVVLDSQPVALMVMPFFFILMLLLPGYLLGIILFPGRKDLSGSRRAAISLCASALLSLLSSIILSLSPSGWHLSSITALLAASALVLAVIAHLSRSALPRSRRFVPGYSPSLRNGRREGVPRILILTFLALAIMIIISAFAHTMIIREKIIEEAPASGKQFTEFYVMGGNDSIHPSQVIAGSVETTIAGIINHESRAIRYTLRLSLNGSTLLQKDIDLDKNQAWEEAISYPLKESGDRQRVDFLLYKNGNFKSPYREDCLWFNVSEAGTVPFGSMKDGNSKSESEKESNNESQISPVTLQQTTRIMPIGAEEFNEKDKSKNKEKAIAAASVKKSAESAPEQTSISEIESDLPGEPDIGSVSSNASVEEAVSPASAFNRSDNARRNASSLGSVFGEEAPENREKLVATAVTRENDVKSNLLQNDHNPSGPIAEDKSEPAGATAESSASSKDGASVSDMDREIDSWVGSRGIGKSSQGQSYESKNIKYVKKGDTSERAVLGSKEAKVSMALGSQSKTPLRLG